MDPSRAQSAPSVEEDEWDTDGYVLPSLAVGDTELGSSHAFVVEDPKVPPPQVSKEEKIYLGPHGAPPSQAKQQELNPAGRRQRFKSKVKEADRKFAGFGHENKIETLRELTGGQPGGTTMQKGSNRDWLDPHCHESQFERYFR